MTTSSRFPWYDGKWLDYFVTAKTYIGARRPLVLPRFLEALSPLRTNLDFSTSCLRNFLDDVELAHVKDVISGLKPSQLALHEIKHFGRWVVQNHPKLIELQDRMTTRVEEVAGEALEPSYNILSMYTRLGRCPVHQDAPNAKWTLDICVDQSEAWPIHLSQVRPWPEDQVFPESDWESFIKDDPHNQFVAQLLTPGDAVLFSGSSQWHYRDPIATTQQNAFAQLLFFHFVPRGMSKCQDPADWEAYFDVPGLGVAMGNPARRTIGR